MLLLHFTVSINFSAIDISSSSQFTPLVFFSLIIVLAFLSLDIDFYQIFEFDVDLDWVFGISKSMVKMHNCIAII